MPADPIHQRSSDCPNEGESNEKCSAVHRALNTDIAHFGGAIRKLFGLALAVTKQLHQECSRNIEAFGHLRIHRSIEIESPTSDRRQPTPNTLGRNDENWQNQDSNKREAPFQVEHRDQRGDEHDDVRNNRSKRCRHRALSSDDIVIEAAHQRAGLSSREETNRHGGNVIEQFHSKVVNQTFADS